MPSPYHASLCLRQALLLKATPSQPVSVHRRRMPRLCFAVALHSTALRRGAVAVCGPSWPSYPMPLRVGSLPVLRGAVRFVAPPSPIAPELRWAVPPPLSATQSPRMPLMALLFLRHARPRSAYPSPRSTSQSLSIASPSKSKRFLRRAPQRLSFAAIGLAGLLRRRAARRYARPFRRLPEQIKALPLQRPSPRRHRAARPSHANPLPPTSSRCRRISLKASPRCSVAPPHNATQIHRRTMPLMALPSRIIATLR